MVSVCVLLLHTLLFFKVMGKHMLTTKQAECYLVNMAISSKDISSSMSFTKYNIKKQNLFLVACLYFTILFNFINLFVILSLFIYLYIFFQTSIQLPMPTEKVTGHFAPQQFVPVLSISSQVGLFRPKTKNSNHPKPKKRINHQRNK